MIVAGAGGYNARLHLLHKAFHKAKLPITMPGSDGALESFAMISMESPHCYP